MERGHYALDLDYDLAGNRLRGEAVHRRGRRRGRPTRVVLDLAGLDVAKVTVDGGRRRSTRRAATGSWSRSARRWPPGTSFACRRQVRRRTHGRSSTSTTGTPAGRSSPTA